MEVDRRKDALGVAWIGCAMISMPLLVALIAIAGGVLGLIARSYGA